MQKRNISKDWLFSLDGGAQQRVVPPQMHHLGVLLHIAGHQADAPIGIRRRMLKIIKAQHAALVIANIDLAQGKDNSKSFSAQGSSSTSTTR